MTYLHTDPPNINITHDKNHIICKLDNCGMKYKDFIVDFIQEDHDGKNVTIGNCFGTDSGTNTYFNDTTECCVMNKPSDGEQHTYYCDVRIVRNNESSIVLHAKNSVVLPPQSPPEFPTVYLLIGGSVVLGLLLITVFILVVSIGRIMYKRHQRHNNYEPIPGNGKKFVQYIHDSNTCMIIDEPRHNDDPPLLGTLLPWSPSRSSSPVSSLYLSVMSQPPSPSPPSPSPSQQSGSSQGKHKSTPINTH